MLIKTNKKDKNGRDIYVNAFTGGEQKLQRRTGKHKNYIPNGVYMRFRYPAPTEMERNSLFK